MNRIGFVLKVRPDLLEEYRRHHQVVWPEMLDALRRNGWHNYTLFLQPDGTLFGYFETEGSLEQALAGMAGAPGDDPGGGRCYRPRAGAAGALLPGGGPQCRPDDGSARGGLPPGLGQPTLSLSYLVNGPMRMRSPSSRVGSFSIV